MKKIYALLGLLFVSNVIAADLNLGLVMSGNTSDVVCYVHSSPTDPNIYEFISCDNRAGISTGTLRLGKQANQGAILAGFVASGRWELSTSFVGRGKNTVFLFTKK